MQTLDASALFLVHTRDFEVSHLSYAPQLLSPITSDLLVRTGFTPDVKLWEVEYSKAGEFQQVLT